VIYVVVTPQKSDLWKQELSCTWVRLAMMFLHGLCSTNIWLCWRKFWSVVYLASLAAVPSLWLFIVVLQTDFPKGMKRNKHDKYSHFKVSWWWCIELHFVNFPSSTFIKIINFRILHVSPSSDGDLDCVGSASCCHWKSNLGSWHLLMGPPSLLPTWRWRLIEFLKRCGFSKHRCLGNLQNVCLVYEKCKWKR